MGIGGGNGGRRGFIVRLFFFSVLFNMRLFMRLILFFSTVSAFEWLWYHNLVHLDHKFDNILVRRGGGGSALPDPLCVSSGCPTVLAVHLRALVICFCLRVVRSGDIGQ